jgi:hypothetical protein
MGVIAVSAAVVSRQLRPAILPLSSIRNLVSNSVRKAYAESAADWIGPATVAELMGGEYAGGAASLTGFGRRVGVVVVNGFVMLLFAAGNAEAALDERDLDDTDDLESRLETSFRKLKGILCTEDVLDCEQKVGVVERTILFAGLLIIHLEVVIVRLGSNSGGSLFKGNSCEEGYQIV